MKSHLKTTFRLRFPEAELEKWAALYDYPGEPELAEKITRDEVEPLAQGIIAWHKALAPAGDTTCVFRDSAFADDVAKTNLAAILQQHGLASVRSL